MGLLSEYPVLASVLLIGVGIVLRLLVVKKQTGPLPPGPKGLPLVGSINDLPPRGVHEWTYWLKYKDSYGPISSVTTFGTTFVLLHSPELAVELLEKRSSSYSSRPRFVFGGEMIGFDHLMVLRQYGDRSGVFGKNVHKMIGTQAAILPYMPLQETETHRFLFRVLQDPEGLLAHVNTEVGTIILKMVYGYTADPLTRDPLVNIGAELFEYLSKALSAGAWLVDIIPALRYVPDWMPGAGFKRIAKKWEAVLMEAANKPFQFTRQQMTKGTSGKSYVADFGLGLTPEEEYMVKWTAISLYTASVDTSVATVMTFFLVMTLYPEIQRKAQEEIDRVIGWGRLPKFSDQNRLPYVSAVVKEVIRWHPITPLAFPHAATHDDVVDGYYIPKGAIIIPNLWWFMHDPAVYPNPSAFDPLRHLGPDPCPDPVHHAFGYGRRICPGKQFGLVSVWLTIAQSLAVFDIGKGLDEDGVEIDTPTIDPTVLFTPGAINQPKPFKATIKPRSSQHEDLIRQVETLHPWEKGDADELEGIAVPAT